MNAYLIEATSVAQDMSPVETLLKHYYIITYPRLSIPVFKKLIFDKVCDCTIVKVTLYDENVNIAKNKIWNVGKYGKLEQYNDYDAYVADFEEEI